MWLNNYIEYIGYDVLWIAIPIFIYVIGYYSLKQPELFRIRLVHSLSDPKERLSKGEAQLLKAKLDSLMENEQVFLRNNLTLGEVAKMLHTSTHNVSWLLNNSYGVSFYDFVNGYRIREFIQKIDKKEHLKQTILALSMDVGFNSKSTFNKAFKQTMKDTPSNWIKKYSAA
jgi:AraC-like DNA-binding protein